MRIGHSRRADGLERCERALAFATPRVQHTVEEMSLGSKEQAELWGGKYRDKIDVISAVKSVTTPIFPYPIRLNRDGLTGALLPHASQPAEYKPKPLKS